MKQNKLTPRLILILAIILVGVYYLFPTFRYENLRKTEEREAASVAKEMGVSYAYVIENLYRDESILQDKLGELTDITESKRNELSSKISHLQGPLQEQLLKYRKSAIKRGLDLQGGMHMVLEVDIIQLMRNLARQRDARLERLLADVEKQLNDDPQIDFNDVVASVFRKEDVRLSMYFGEAGESDATILAFLNTQAEDAINRSLEILRNRIDQFGVSEPSIQKKGNRRILMELPGVQDPARARDLIGRTAQLEFKLMTDGERAQQFIQDVDKYLAQKSSSTSIGEIQSDEKDTAEVDSLVVTEAADDAHDLAAAFGDTGSQLDADQMGAEIISEQTPFSSMLRGIGSDIAVPAEYLRQIRAYLADPGIARLIPEGSQIAWSAKPEVVNEQEYHLMFFLKRAPELTGGALSDARVDIGGGGSDFGNAGKAVVSLTMNRAGARTFARVTGANIDKRLAIVLDDRVYMAPVIRSKIPNGRAVIEGLTSVDEANDLSIVLRAGALPTSVIIEEERTVGPSLGRDSIQKGTMSALIGFALVVVFMIVYYGMSGIIANVALLLNILLIFGGLAFFGAMGMGATLSLPGIAGIILTIGMAVDANVLIFERIREELATGKTVWAAIAAGYDKAFSTILDSNVTTLIAAFVLLQFGTGPIRGFAVTLSIGIACSMFTAIVVTRLIFDYITSRKTLTRLSI